MRKVFIFILAVIYFTTSIGAVINMHYCMGKATGWKLWETSSGICGNCGMEENDSVKKDDCCRNEQTLVKNIADQKITVAGLVVIQAGASGLGHHFTETPIDFRCSTSNEKYIHSSRRTKTVEVYLRNCVFLI